MVRNKFIINYILLASILAIPNTALGVRPFITDDARVTDSHIFQIENWLQVSKFGFQNWSVLSTSFDKLETSVGLMWGKQNKEPVIESPLLQLKILGIDPAPGLLIPGVAASVGIFPKKDSTEVFEYLALTESLDKKDRYLVHQNIGISSSFSKNENVNKLILGIGSQIYVYQNFYFIGEFFSGDPYNVNAFSGFQLGSRYFISSTIQLDASIGRSFEYNSYLWGTVGCRLSTTKMAK